MVFCKSIGALFGTCGLAAGLVQNGTSLRGHFDTVKHQTVRRTLCTPDTVAVASLTRPDRYVINPLLDARGKICSLNDVLPVN